MKGRWKKFLSYYTNYKVLFFKDMFCAMVSAAITLCLSYDYTLYYRNDFKSTKN